MKRDSIINIPRPVTDDLVAWESPPSPAGLERPCVSYPWLVFIIASSMPRHVFKLVITQLKDIDLEIDCEGGERQKKGQIQAQVHDKCYPTELLPEK